MFRREEEFLEKNKNISLLEQHKELQQMAEGRKETMLEKQRKEEERILKVTNFLDSAENLQIVKSIYVVGPTC